MFQSAFFRFCLYTAVAVLVFLFASTLGWTVLVVFSCMATLLLMLKLGKIPDNIQPILIGIRKRMPFNADSTTYSRKTTSFSSQETPSPSYSQEPVEKKRDDESRLKEEVRAELEVLAGQQDDALGIINNLVEQVVAAQNDNQIGFGVHSPSVLFAISGPSGSGKTHISNVLGKLFYSFGALPSKRTVTLTKSKLSGYDPFSVIEQHVGTTNGGAVVFDDADWMFSSDPYTQVSAINDIGIAIAEFVAANPKQYVVVMNGSQEGIEGILNSDDHKKWLRNFHVVQIKTKDLDSNTLTKLLEELLEQKGWHLSQRAGMEIEKHFSQLKRSEREYFGYAHEARSLADKLIAHRRQQAELSGKQITHKEVRGILDYE
ncbi:TPA: hypothetical protein N2810_001263 [Vibrio parahaemolyticus]|nr:hypothetical protein [Vibrio parahaemolyticus]